MCKIQFWFLLTSGIVEVAPPLFFPIQHMFEKKTNGFVTGLGRESIQGLPLPESPRSNTSVNVHTTQTN